MNQQDGTIILVTKNNTFNDKHEMKRLQTKVTEVKLWFRNNCTNKILPNNSKSITDFWGEHGSTKTSD